MIRPSKEVVLRVLQSRLDEKRGEVATLERSIEAMSNEDVFCVVKNAFKKKTQKRETTFDRIRFFFESSENGVQFTVKDITNLTHSNYETVRQVLYKTHPEKFERESAGGGGVPTKFRLKP